MSRWLSACAMIWSVSVVFSLGCVLLGSQRSETDLSRRLWAGDFAARWDSYSEYFKKRGGCGHCSSGREHSFTLDGTLREGRGGDFIRALRADLLDRSPGGRRAEMIAG